jgi:hypothetical protein
MAAISVAGDTSGSVTLQAPAVAGASVLTLPVATDTLVGKATTDTLTNKTLTSPVISGTPSGVGTLTSGTAVASTSGTSIDFTGIPSWAKRITVMFSDISTNGASSYIVQTGAGSITTTGYSSGIATNGAGGSATNGHLFVLGGGSGYISSGSLTLTLLNSSTNLWVSACSAGRQDAATASVAGGRNSLSGALDRVRITTVNGTDTFDAGSINIMYE